MVAKIAVVVVSLAACALALLAMRQLRTQSAHELAAARLRIIEADAQLLRVRAAIAQAAAPAAIAEAARELGPFEPVMPEDDPPLAHPGLVRTPESERRP